MEPRLHVWPFRRNVDGVSTTLIITDLDRPEQWKYEVRVEDGTIAFLTKGGVQDWIERQVKKARVNWESYFGPKREEEISI